MHIEQIRDVGYKGTNGQVSSRERVFDLMAGAFIKTIIAFVVDSLMPEITECVEDVDIAVKTFGDLRLQNINTWSKADFPLASGPSQAGLLLALNTDRTNQAIISLPLSHEHTITMEQLAEEIWSLVTTTNRSIFARSGSFYLIAQTIFDMMSSMILQDEDIHQVYIQTFKLASLGRRLTYIPWKNSPPSRSTRAKMSIHTWTKIESLQCTQYGKNPSTLTGNELLKEKARQAADEEQKKDPMAEWSIFSGTLQSFAPFIQCLTPPSDVDFRNAILGSPNSPNFKPIADFAISFYKPQNPVHRAFTLVSAIYSRLCGTHVVSFDAKKYQTRKVSELEFFRNHGVYLKSKKGPFNAPALGNDLLLAALWFLGLGHGRPAVPQSTSTQWMSRLSELHTYYYVWLILD